jgi:hypothetical protein
MNDENIVFVVGFGDNIGVISDRIENCFEILFYAAIVEEGGYLVIQGLSLVSPWFAYHRNEGVNCQMMFIHCE